jgi:HEPN domain-containing protein
MVENELLQQWLDKANDDLRIAEHLITMYHPTPSEIICFHCQQSAEKYLKGFLFINDIEPPKTHDLNELLGMCSEINSNFSVLSSKMGKLTDYAVTSRYPNELRVTSDDARIAIKYAKDVEEFALKVIDEFKSSC